MLFRNQGEPPIFLLGEEWGFSVFGLDVVGWCYKLGFGPGGNQLWANHLYKTSILIYFYFCSIVGFGGWVFLVFCLLMVWVFLCLVFVGWLFFSQLPSVSMAERTALTAAAGGARRAAEGTPRSSCGTELGSGGAPFRWRHVWCRCHGWLTDDCNASDFLQGVDLRWREREEGEILHDSVDLFFEVDVEVICLWISPSGKAEPYSKIFSGVLNWWKPRWPTHSANWTFPTVCLNATEVFI